MYQVQKVDRADFFLKKEPKITKYLPALTIEIKDSHFVDKISKIPMIQIFFFKKVFHI